MDADAVVHALPITVDYGGQDLAITPAVVETERGLVLFDVGPAESGAVDAIETHLRALEYELTDIWLVILTHHDGDHAGALETLLDRTDAMVAAHREETPYVTGERDPIKGSGDDRYPPVSVDIELVGGVCVPTLAGPFEVVETPGHSTGHISIHFPDGELLVAGDALVADGPGDGADRLAGPKPEFTPKMERALESVATLADLDVTHTLCYHGGYVPAGADRIREIAESDRH
ncbi:beta-lactamase [Natrialba chahannaoensis JCM 10990]|uniref:Beta-lactamase n=1 Tax=Natrialba chahannaoensis JCM 10990 TaxID=1227492 RepID=M0B5S7_9EURY|nr:MBL fold metallo-hydrolase [Natrialba chahannaoensis]ELZ05608.1 beta-lactamase [Natrialba chahannaoensis JCM 10990]